MQHILAIISAESEYACSLMEFLNQQSGFLFCARTFTSIEAYLEYEKQHIVDLLLFDQTIPAEALHQTKARTILYLSENPKEANYEGYVSLFMYQSAKKLMECAQKEYEAAGNHLPEYSGSLQTNILGVCSVSGDYRQSAFSLALADEYRKRGKTLWISLQPFLSAEIFQMPEKALLSEMIYILKQEEGNQAGKLKELMEHYDSMDYLVGVEHYSDLAELNREEITQLFTILETHCSYDTIILDLPVLTKGLNDWLTKCSKVYELQFAGCMQEQASKQFHRQLGLQDEGEIQKVLCEVDCSNVADSKESIGFPMIVSGIWGELVSKYCE